MSINVDIMPVEDENEAFVLMKHHLCLAASYFEATPDPLPQRPFAGLFAGDAMQAFVDELAKRYPDG